MTTRLRSLAFTLVFCLASHVCFAQWVAIPDTNFATFLNGTHSLCMQGDNINGWEMDTTCTDIVFEFSLNCEYYDISSLEGIQFFDNLEELICGENQINYLPKLPNTLITLHCGPNLLDSLPQLPGSLKYLYCYNNNITSLPTLPDSLLALDCYANHIRTLPILPPSLIQLGCGANDIISLPDLPASLVDLNIVSSQIAHLPTLPDSLYSLDFSYCPNIHCLPQLNKIRNFYFSGTGLTCLPNYPQSNVISYPLLKTMPLCDTSSYNVYGCGVYWNISGKVYEDTSSNCLNDVGETTFNNLKVNLYEGGNLLQQMNTLGGGSYSFNTDFSTYQYSLDTASLPFTVACPNNGFYTSVITALDSFNADMNFGLHCKPGFDLEARSIATPTVFRPANYTQVNITAGDASNFYNAHCAAGVSGAVTVTINGSAHYTAPASGALTPTVNANTLTYTFADFGAVDFFHDFNIIVQTDTTAMLGSHICITVSVTPTTGDNNPANNTLTICFPVVGSYDPNDKTAYPAGDIDTAQKEITYTVRFQNTGTAEAQHIYITDTLDTDIDEGSFQLLAYSHQPMVQIEQNRVRFNFPNINLPDSNTNEPLSHGYVQYKVKLKDNLPIGTEINNTAHIYFDFNAPVVTNTTSNTITTNTGIQQSAIGNLSKPNQ